MPARRYFWGLERPWLLFSALLFIPACGGGLDAIIQSNLAGIDQFGTDPGPPVYTARSFVNWESPHVSPLALTPDGGRLLAVNTPAARLEVFDVDEGGISHVRTIPVGLDPVTVRARSRDEAWVANFVSASVSVVDVERGLVTRTLETGAEPTDIAFAQDRAFVVCRQGSRVDVFNLHDLAAPPQTLTIDGLHPRAAALSPDGGKLYVAIFDSGNGTTVLAHDAVSDPTGPYGGTNPPPNTPAGISPSPPTNASPAPPAALIVQRDPATGRWLDEQGANWSAFVSWGLHGHDVAIIDTRTLTVDYIRDLMNLNMSLAVHPDGTLTVVGTEAFNAVRFEPRLTGHFVRGRLALVSPAAPDAPQILELNPHLLDAYASGQSTISPAQRALSIADPRAIVWSADGQRGYIAGMGSNNVAVITPDGVRVATFDVSQGPTGLALDETHGRLYVLNRFDASISSYEVETLTLRQQLRLYDPTPEAIRRGRPFLYDARLTSGLGVTACAACHVDGRTDQLAWDLGIPDGLVKPFDQVCDDLGNGKVASAPCEDFHPIKGPMMTQTLQGIIGTEPFHWRGDRVNLSAFNHAFVGLNGRASELTPEEMAALEGFLASISFPPNPNRNRDNSLKSELDGGNPQHGEFIFLHEPIDRTSPQNLHGLPEFLRERLEEIGPILTCNRCHQLPTGTNRRITSAINLTLPQSMKVPQLRHMYEKIGFDRSSFENRHGYGFSHDGAIATLEEFFGADVFDFGPGAEGAQRVQDVIAFMKSLGVDTHAGVGWQITVDASRTADPDALQTMATMLQLADQGDVGLVVHGLLDDQRRGLWYQGAGVFGSDSDGLTWTTAQLQAAPAGGAVLTWTVVPLGSEKRLGRLP